MESSGSSEEQSKKTTSHVKALLRRRLKDLNGFPKPKCSQGEEQGPGVVENRGDAGEASGREEDGAGKTATDGEDDPNHAEGRSGPEEGVRDGDCTAVPASESDAQDELKESSVLLEDRGPESGSDASVVEVSGRVSEPETSAAAAIEMREESEATSDEQSRVGRSSETLPCSTPDVGLEGLRQDRGVEASTSGSEPHTSQAPKPADVGGLGRWLTSLTAESPIIWDQNTGRLWLGGGGQLSPGDALGNGTQSIGAVLWGNGEDADVESLWRDSEGVEDDSDADESWPEGPPVYRLRVTSVAFKSPAGVEVRLAGLGVHSVRRKDV